MVGSTTQSVQGSPAAEEAQLPKPSYVIGTKVECNVALDFVYVGDKIACVAKVEPHGYRLSRWTKRDAVSIFKVIHLIVSTVKAAKGVARVLEVRLDRERGAAAASNNLTSALEVLLKQSVPYRHQRSIERDIRTHRNNHRICLGSLKVPITPVLVLYAWEHAVKLSNFLPNSRSGEFLPYQIQYATESYWTPPEFGRFVVAEVGKPTNKTEQVREVGMVLGFEENTSAILVKFRNQREPVWRNRFSDTDQVKALKYYLDGTEPDEEQAYDPDEEDPDVDVRRVSTDDLDLCFEEKSDALQSAEEVLRMLTVGNVPNVVPPPQVEEHQLPVADVSGEDVVRRSSRVRKPYEKYPRSDFVLALRAAVCRLKNRPDNTLALLEQAEERAKVPGKDGEKAANIVEILNLWKVKKAFKPVKLPDDVPGDEDQEFEIVQGKFFTVEKRDSRGEFLRVKTRGVARGDQRRSKPRTVKETFPRLDRSTPSTLCSTTSLSTD